MAKRRKWMGTRRSHRTYEWLRTATPHHTGAPRFPLNLVLLAYDGTVDQVLDCQNILLGDEPYVTQSIVEERKTYTVDRIVGRLEAQLTGGYGGVSGATWEVPIPVIFKWGIFVSDVDETGVPLQLDEFDLFNPIGEEASWLHRDSYALGWNASGASASTVPWDPPSVAASCMPDSTVSRAPWGMVDIGVKRHIGQLQRLFLMTAIESNADESKLDPHTYKAFVTVWKDLRILGHWTKR